MFFQTRALDDALFESAECGDLEAVTAQLMSGAEARALSGLEGRTALHAAAKGNFFGICAALMDAAALVNAQDNAGNTPLHLAVEQGHAWLAALLLMGGADYSVKNNHGESPYAIACLELPEMGRWLKRLDPARYERRGLWAVQHWAAAHGLVELFDAGFDWFDRSETDGYGRTTLHWAASSGSIDLVTMLLEAPADYALLDARDEAGWTPLQVAAKAGHTEIVHFLSSLLAEFHPL